MHRPFIPLWLPFFLNRAVPEKKKERRRKKKKKTIGGASRAPGVYF